MSHVCGGWQETNGVWLGICMLPRERAVNAWLCVMAETGEVTLQQTDAKLCGRRAELWTLSLRARMVLQVEAGRITSHHIQAAHQRTGSSVHARMSIIV
jgi:hypothetical protein